MDDSHQSPSPETAETTVYNTSDEIITSGLSEFIATEYESLIALFIHAEEAKSGLFNFYVTLLTAVVGGVILLTQVQSIRWTSTLLLALIDCLLIFVVLVGVIVQDGIVNKSMDMFRLALALNLLKQRVLMDSNDWQDYLMYLKPAGNQFRRVNPVLTEDVLHFASRADRKLWFLLPLESQQLFIGFINSVAVALVCVITVSLVVGSVSPTRALVVGIVVAFTTFIIHSIYSRYKHDLGTRKLLTVSKVPVPW